MNQNYSKLLLFISVLDIMENEIGSGHRLTLVLQETIHFFFYYQLLINFSLMNYWPF